ncbi:MAG: uracil-DNA glycosylase [Dissulfurispiraceae bacterium]|jgi:uracil-DNA glycosylase
MDKRLTLAEIANEIEKCRKCKVGKSGLAVPGEGDPNADIMFVGEAPGKEEAKCGRPFIGRSGKLLRSTITGINLREQDVYITSPVKYLPDRGTPTVEDIAHGRVHLFKQLEVINPRIIVLLGNSACLAVLGNNTAVTGEHGKVIEKDGMKCLITFHPAAAMRFPKIKAGFLDDFGILKKLIQDLSKK